MSETDAQALLGRLVAQFASPYDFLRELVQNSLDAGSDRVEVTLDAIPSELGVDDTVVHTLTIADTGSGMDESIIDGGLTRLFASTKSDDRTMAGGFGIGFVSVFAWEPEAVLVQTGRAGESWEVLFYGVGDRRFEKRKLDVPVEGTTITLVRRGPESEGRRIAEAVRDSLWRWCRYCRLEITFENLSEDDPLELIQDSPAAIGGELSYQDASGDHTIRVGFAVPSRAVLLRRGLILAEGGVRELLPGLAAQLGEGCDHLQVWVDSPSLRTTLARDKVVLDGGHGQIEAKVGDALAILRSRLLEGLVQSAAAGAREPEVAAVWGAVEHRRYAFLHGHLAAERASIGEGLAKLEILRERTTERPWSPAKLGRELAGRPILYTVSGPSGPDGEALGLARAIGYPVIAGDVGDHAWLTGFSTQLGVGLSALGDALGEVTPAQPEPESERVRAATEATLRRLGGRLGELCLAIGHFVGDRPRPALVAGELARGGERVVVLHSLEALAGPPPKTLWIDVDEALLRVVAKAGQATLVAAVIALAAAIAGLVGGDTIDAETLADAAKLSCAEIQASTSAAADPD